MACTSRAPRTAELVARQPLIAEVRRALQQVPTAQFGSAEDCEHAQVVMVREGLFRSLVLLRESRRSADDFLVDALLNPQIRRLPNHRAILRSWIEPFREERERPELDDELVEAADAIAEGPSAPYGRAFDRQARFAKVEAQKAAIIAAMKAGNLDRARAFIAKLIDFQTSGGQDPKYACMSLCDLAIQAKSQSLPALQLELSRTATELKHEDAWPWVQYADALLHSGSLGEALLAAENAISFGEVAAGKNLRAEVLRAMGRLDDALACYDEVIESFPANAVARVGQASLLKVMNRLDGALSAYDSAIVDFPESVVARTGRAEVLRSMNRLEEALSAYDAVIADFPQDVYARTGKAEVLLSMDRLEDALAAYNAVIVEFPQSVVARNGRAEVLQWMNRLEEAFAAYDAVIVDIPHAVYARTYRAEVLRSMNRLEEALAAYGW